MNKNYSLLDNAINEFLSCIDEAIDMLQQNRWSVFKAQSEVDRSYYSTIGYVKCLFDLNRITYEDNDDCYRYLQSKYEAVKRHFQIKLIRMQRDEENNFYRLKKR